jgi:hypothetical protein
MNRLLLILVAACSARLACADTVVVDRSQSIVLSVNSRLHYRDDADLGDSALAATTFTGNGERLNTVGLYFTIGTSAGVQNQGDLDSLGWDVYVWAPSSDFAIDPWRLNPPVPSFFHRFDHPTNLGWRDVLFQLSNGKDVRYAEVDVSALEIGTAPGQTYAVTLLPSNGISSDGTISRVVQASGGIGGPDLYFYANAGYGPGPASGFFGAGAPNAGFRATTRAVVAPTGACCHGTNCTVVDSAACSSSGGVYHGDSTTCGTSGNPTTCCPANFDGQNGLQVADIFAFLNAWFAGDSRADFDANPGLQVADIFAFLNAWFSGC